MAKENNDTLFRKYHRRIAKEGIVKSLLFGLIAGSCALLISALLSWFFGFKGGLWLSLALFAAIFAATSLSLYFVKFRPTTKQIAARVDALGLEERLITMIELENDDSYIAARQREDAVRAMKSVDSMLLKIVVSVSLITLLAVSLVVGIGGGTTVSSLYYAGAIQSGMELIEGEEKFFVFNCTYTVASGDETGIVVLWSEELASAEVDPNDPTAGLTPLEESFTVKEGEDAPAVYAVPKAGYVFLMWSDGQRDPYRKDTHVLGALDVSAVFAPVSGNFAGIPEDGYVNLKQPDDPDDGRPGPPDPDGNPNKNDSDTDIKRDDRNQQIIDSNHYYGDSFEDSYNDAQERLGSDGNISEELKEWISEYYSNIGTSGSENGGDLVGNP